MLLAPATQSAPPQCQQSLSEHRKTVEVSWYRIVVEVTLHDRSEPLSRLSYRIMHASMKLLLKLPQFAPHALADRFASHGEAPQFILPANMREAQDMFYKNMSSDMCSLRLCGGRRRDAAWSAGKASVERNISFWSRVSLTATSRTR